MHFVVVTRHCPLDKRVTTSRFCIVGQSASSGAFASKTLKLAVFGKSVSSGLDLGLSVRAVEATASAWERCLADCERNALELLAAPKQVND